ncbi:MAG: amidohydrolase family protein [Planctomycetes bacterium]|nr:amidohydrolase family protein [Planctomycetota bacterium]
MSNAIERQSSVTRRELLTVAAGALAATALAGVRSQAAEDNRPLIIDTHVHLWDLKKFTLPWLEMAPELFRRDYLLADYQQAIAGFNVRSMYMEVDVTPEQHEKEAQFASALDNQSGSPFIGAVVGGRPGGAGFGDYVATLKKLPRVSGVRQVLHAPTTPQGFCLKSDFVRGVQLLGKHGLTFDMCMRPTDISDCVALAEQCPDTQLVLDHCGNGDPKAFRKVSDADKPAAHDASQWRRDIEKLAQRKNVACKISGAMFHAPKGWTTADMAPVVNHCLDSFGMDRVVFGADWPVCLVGGTFARWVGVVAELIASRSAADRQKLWSENAQRVYGLSRS